MRSDHSSIPLGSECCKCFWAKASHIHMERFRRSGMNISKKYVVLCRSRILLWREAARTDKLLNHFQKSVVPLQKSGSRLKHDRNVYHIRSSHHLTASIYRIRVPNPITAPVYRIRFLQPITEFKHSTHSRIPLPATSSKEY